MSPSERISILVIDDEIRPDDALVRLLSIDGFDVTCAETGRHGSQLALTDRWDALVLDLHLPDVLCITVLSDLKQKGFSSPILVVTGWYDDAAGHQNAATALGAAGFLRKPVMADELGQVLRTTITAPAPPLFRPSEGSDLRPASSEPQTSRHRKSSSDTDAALCRLQRLACGGDAAALDSLCERLLPLLERSLRRWPNEWVHDAVQDALIEFRANVRRFDSTRGVPLQAFLRTAARRNLLNRLAAERRHRVRESSEEPGVIDAHVAAPAPELERQIDLKRALSSVWSGLSDIERNVFRLVLRGERRAERLARAANAAHLRESDQRRVVKRITNRIFQRMRRLRLGKSRK